MRMENKGKRLAEAIEYLKQEGIINSLDDVAQKVDRSKNNISSAINGDKRYLSDKFLKHFNACFKNIFSLTWLLRGEGMMCCEKNLFDNQEEEKQPDQDHQIALLQQQLKRKDDLLMQKDDLIAMKDNLIAEKERLIQVLLAKSTNIS